MASTRNEHSLSFAYPRDRDYFTLLVPPLVLIQSRLYHHVLGESQTVGPAELQQRHADTSDACDFQQQQHVDITDMDTDTTGKTNRAGRGRFGLELLRSLRFP